MRFGFMLPTRGPQSEPDSLRHLAQLGEALGFAFATANDHLVVPRDIASRYPYSAEGDWPAGQVGEAQEQLTLLSYIAGITTKLRLIPSVMVVPHRKPVHTARILATLDWLSKGRLTVGCGVGWMREEFEALDAPPFEARGRAADEYLQAFKTLWCDDAPSFSGAFVSFSNIVFAPKPVQKPHPPLWIGGESAPARRRAAKLGNGWYPIFNNPKHPLDTPARHRAAVEAMHAQTEAQGRDPAAIDLALSVGHSADEKPAVGGEGRQAFSGSASAFLDDSAAYAKNGIRWILVNLQGGSLTETEDTMRGFAETIIKETSSWA